MQFSLKWLLAFTAFVAVSLVALINANGLWLNSFRTAVLASVLVATLGALWSVGRSRAFCGGYAIVAVCFFTRFFGEQLASDFITHDALSAIHARAFHFTQEDVRNLELVRQSDYFDIVGVPVSNADGSATILVVRPKRHYFLEIGHSACSILVGIIGGYIAMWFYRRRATVV